MAETDALGTGPSNPAGGHRDTSRTHRLSSSPQHALSPSGQPLQHPGRLPSPAPVPAASSSSGRHSHSRSKSVNLSPTISASGSSFASGSMRWEGYAPELASTPGSTSVNHLTSVARVGSPLLRPSSPLYVNMRGASPSGNDPWKLSPSYASSESGSSDGGSSPEIRRGSHFTKPMERSSSSGSVGGNGGSHLSPHSPRSSFRRTASPSRAYAIPLSPRLQAFGTPSHHSRRYSGGSNNQVTLGEPMLRSGSPMSGGGSDLAIDADPGLPIDTVWPASVEAGGSNGNHDAEAIPIEAGKGISTPVPPSLRDELTGNSRHAIVFPGPSSPGRRAYSSSPQDHLLFRDQRTPSPSGWAPRRERKSPTSPVMHASLARNHSHSSPSSMPNLAAPRPIVKRALNLEAASQLPPQHHHFRRVRTDSNSSNGSIGSLELESEEAGVAATNDESPTRKVLSPPGVAQTQVDAQNALAQVGLGPSIRDDPGSEIRAEDEQQSDEHISSSNSRARREVDGLDGEIVRTGDASRASSLPSSSAMTSLESTKAVASAHGIQHASPHSQRGHHLARATSLPTLNGNVVLGPNGTLFRAKSPAPVSPLMESVSLSESPPKTRSFIGMPPRSGYELSDDPDDVGSEDGSTGSGRESVGTNEDRDIEDDNDEDDDEDDEDDRDGEQIFESELQDDMESGHLDDNEDLGAQQPRPSSTAVPKRPGLTQSSIVTSVPAQRAVEYQGGESMLWTGEGGAVARKRADLALTRNDGEEDEDEDREAEGEQEENLDQEQEGLFGVEGPTEESLSTLERIFLFAKSEMAYHRVLVSNSLADWILEVELSDAVEFVIPLLNGLACDENDVCIAFAPQLHRVMWHFLRNCPLVEDDEYASQSQSQHGSNDDEGAEKATRPRLSVAVFTPLLCALLLNSNAAIAGSTQASIVHFFSRLQGFSLLDADQADTNTMPEEERQQQQQQQQFSSGKAQPKEPFDLDTALIRDAAARGEKRVALEGYDFSEGTRKMVMDELLDHVALAIGNLNIEHATHAKEGDSQNGHIDRHDAGDDSVMDDVPLTPNTASQSGDDLDTGDTEMSLDLLEEGIGSQEETQAGDATASLDNVSMTMSDVEEEVAVGRMACISLLAALGAEDLVSRLFLVDRIVPEMVKFASDHTFFVRKEVAVSMGALAKSIGYDIIKEQNLLAILEDFCQDRIWHVRQAACLSLPNLFAQVPEGEVKRTKVVDIMRSFVGDVSRNVRVAALDIIGEMIYLFYEDGDGVPLELVRHFLGEAFDVDNKGGNIPQSTMAKRQSGSSSAGHDSMLDESLSAVADMGWGGLPRSISTANANGPSGWSIDSNRSGPTMIGHPNVGHMDPDRPLVMAYNFPAVILTLGKLHWPKLKEVHVQLCGNASSKARRSLAASLHEIAKIIGVEWTTEDLYSIFHRFLDSRFEKDEEVKMAMLENADVFMAQLALPQALDSLKILLSLWNEEPNGDPARFASNWRLREKLISLIPSLAKRYLLEDDEGVLVVLMQSAIVDSVSSVRMQGIRIVSSLYRIFEESDQVLADGFLGMLVDVGENESYRGRVACLQCLAELCKSQLQRSSVEMLMMNRLVELSSDDVVDVRIALAQLVGLMCGLDELYAMPNSRSDTFVGLLRCLAHDDAVLVQEVILAVLPADDPGREAPQSLRLAREPKKLVLGPSNGELHRPAPLGSSVDSNGNQMTEAVLLELGQEEESGRQGESPMMGNGAKDGSPSLENSMLMKRRFLHRSNQHSSMNADPDSSMFEDADDDEEEEYDDSDEVIEGRWNSLSRSPSEEDTITIPSPDNFLMLSNTDAPYANVLQHDPLDGDDDAPHHLLGVASDSGARLPDSPEHTRQMLSSRGLSLESPERSWNAAGAGSGRDERGTVIAASALPDTTHSPSKQHHDPFLAFVADKRFDQGNDDTEASSQTKLLSSPAGEQPKDLSET